MTSLVAYVGISESGHCGYCKSSRRAKAKIVNETAAAVKTGSGANEQEIAAEIADEIGVDDVEKADQQQKQLAVVAIDGLETAEVNCAPEDEEGNSVVFGLWAHRLTVHAYQSLVDRGWRRSGRYLYKPIMERTCCPQYTIRLDIHKFRLSRTQKRVLKTMRDFLKDDKRPAPKAVVKEEDIGDAVNRPPKQEHRSKNSGEQTGTMSANKPDDVVGSESTKKNMNSNKKKHIRRQKALDRLRARGVDVEQYQKNRAAREQARRRTVQSFLDEFPDPLDEDSKWKHRLEVRLVGQPSAELEDDFDEEFELFRRYQIEVHHDDADELSPESFKRFLAASPLNDDDQEDQQTSGSDENQQQKILGSFHQQYRLDDRIIAVGVVDILPRCLSAKYFFYDPELAFLSLGTFSALQEIAFTQRLCQQRPQLHHYYMGYFLADCPKMRYKGRFRPSELLCDRCFDWVPLPECQRLLERNDGRFTTFHPGQSDEDEPGCHRPTMSAHQMAQLRCIFAQRHLLTLAQLRAMEENGAEEEGGGGNNVKEDIQKLETFARYAGPAAKGIVVAL